MSSRNPIGLLTTLQGEDFYFAILAKKFSTHTESVLQDIQDVRIRYKLWMVWWKEFPMKEERRCSKRTSKSEWHPACDIRERGFSHVALQRFSVDLSQDATKHRHMQKPRIVSTFWQRSYRMTTCYYVIRFSYVFSNDDTAKVRRRSPNDDGTVEKFYVNMNVGRIRHLAVAVPTF